MPGPPLLAPLLDGVLSSPSCRFPTNTSRLAACHRTHDVGVITTVVAEVLTANPDTNLLEIEQAFRENAAAAYLVATTEGFEVVLGMMAMLAWVGKAGVTAAENRAALAAARTSKS